MFTPEIYQHYLRGTEGLHITDGWRDLRLVYSRNVNTKVQQRGSLNTELGLELGLEPGLKPGLGLGLEPGLEPGLESGFSPFQPSGGHMTSDSKPFFMPWPKARFIFFIKVIMGRGTVPAS